MKVDFNNDVLTLFFPDRVDTSNAEQILKEAMDAVEEKKAGKLTLDLEELTYISSAGLRVVLKLKKAVPEMNVIHINKEIMEILDLTGFSDFLGL